MTKSEELFLLASVRKYVQERRHDQDYKLLEPLVELLGHICDELDRHSKFEQRINDLVDDVRAHQAILEQIDVRCNTADH